MVNQFLPSKGGIGLLAQAPGSPLYDSSGSHAKPRAAGDQELLMTGVRLLALAAVSALSLAPATAQPSPSAVQIRVWSFGFAPNPIHLVAGQPVTLQFVNQSGSSHDFTAHRFFESSKIVAGAAPEGEIELHGHETKTVTLIPSPGTYPAHCSHFLHESLGMKDVIVVS
jgi:plastocyanin